jgi:tetratricopeptide (TPR) repeat protein
MLALMAAERQLLSGDLDGALAAYMTILKAEGSASDSALLQRVLTLAGYGEDPALELTLARARLAQKADRAGRLALARALGRAGNYGEALDALAPLAAAAGPEIFDRFVEGVMAGEEAPAAQRFMAQSLAREVFREGATLPLARAQARAGARLFVALQLYEDALILMADAGLSMMDSPQAVSWRAEALEGTGQLRAALAQLEAGLAIFPDAGGLRFARARLQVRLNHLDEARDDFLVLLQRSGENADLLLALALIHLDQNRLVEATTYLDRLEALGERPAPVAFHRGEIAARQGALAAALAYWETVPLGRDYGRMLRRAAYWLRASADQGALLGFADAQFARYPDARERTALALSDALLAEAEGTEAARGVLALALQIKATPSLHYRRGLLAQQAGDFAAAEADLRAVLALAPVHAQALNALGFFLAERGERLEEAQRLVERALELAPGTPAFLDSLGWVAFQRGAYEAALPPLREAFERRGDGEIAAHLGETYWRLGRRNRARQAWLGGLEKDPEDPVLVETVRRLLGDRALTVMRRQLSRGLGGV